jgi:UrcA family protein
VAAALPAAVPAATRSADAPVVRFTSHELVSQEGARRVYARIRDAAGQRCRAQDGADLTRKAQFARCVDATVDLTVAKLDAPLVTSLHTRRGLTTVAWLAGQE